MRRVHLFSIGLSNLVVIKKLLQEFDKKNEK